MTAREAQAEDATVFAKPQDSAPASLVRGKRCTTCGGDFPADFLVCPRDTTPLRSADSHDGLLGAVLGGSYRIIGNLGAGGMGRLYEAEHLRIERRYAIKVIHEAYAHVGQLIARFDAEARSISRIRSDHVVEVIDILRASDGRPCIVFEKLDGEDLENYLERQGRLSVAEALGIAQQVCRGLSAAHQLGIVHRDLKPSNVFMVEQESTGRLAKLLDFGVAKLDDGNLTATGAVVGTPAYMAPEQARGAKNADHRADIYAVGALLFRMLTGQPPYVDEDATATLVRVLEQDPKRPSEIVKGFPLALEALIQEAMARDPNARPSTVEELEAKIMSFARTLPGTPHTAASTVATSWSDTTNTERLEKGARRARPLAVLTSWSAAIMFGAAIVGLLGAIIGSVSSATALTATERNLVGGVGVVAALAVLVTLGREVVRRWRSIPALQRFGSRLGRALVVAVVSAGALDVAGRAWATIDAAPLRDHPAQMVVRLGIAVCLGIGTFLVRRR